MTPSLPRLPPQTSAPLKLSPVPQKARTLPPPCSRPVGPCSSASRLATTPGPRIQPRSRARTELSRKPGTQSPPPRRHERATDSRKCSRPPRARTVPSSPSGGPREPTLGAKRGRSLNVTAWWDLDPAFSAARSVLGGPWGQQLPSLGGVCLGLEHGGARQSCTAAWAGPPQCEGRGTAPQTPRPLLSPSRAPPPHCPRLALLTSRGKATAMRGTQDLPSEAESGRPACPAR